MLEIGKHNSLKLKEKTAKGAMLISADGDEVFMPCKDVPSALVKGESMELFVHTDRNAAVVATTSRPALTRNTCALLEIIDVAKTGAYANWGLNEDLYIPISEQDVDLEAGDLEVIYLYFDEEEKKLLGSTRIDVHLQGDTSVFQHGQEVDLLLFSRSDLGVEAVVNDYCVGMLYANELFRKVEKGQRIKGYVQKVRPDGKLDLNLEKPGHGNVEPNAERILRFLKENKGVMSLNDNSDPAEIKRVLQMSKKNFKRALGYLYGNRLVKLENDKVELVRS